jgi:hypothetical protein
MWQWAWTTFIHHGKVTSRKAVRGMSYTSKRSGQSQGQGYEVTVARASEPLAIIRPEPLNNIVRPENILEEVKEIVSLIFPHFNFNEVISSYQDIIKLFNGEYNGYRKCNITYHDLRHTEDCLLEMARLIHGAYLNGYYVTERSVNLGLISAIMHDTGYIQSVEDVSGTGAKYTIIHVDRSIEFMREYLADKGYSFADFRFCQNCLKCTGLDVNLEDIHFDSLENELMGKILGTADLIGQMADPNYLEKLPFLFKEYQEGGIPDYESEFDLLKKTPDFWEFTQKRFATELGNLDRYLRDHFRVRWGIDRDLDREAIEKNISHLNYILEHHPTDYRRYLGRRVATANPRKPAAHFRC